MTRSGHEVAADILHWYDDAASRQFDLALAATALTPEQQRELRYWQRQSISALMEFAASAVPAVQVALATAQRASADLIQQAAASWDAARRQIGEDSATEAVDPAPEPGPDSLEVRRRTVAARLARVGS